MPPATPAARSSSHGGALAPLRRHDFRWLWVAGVVANIGTWMHEVGAGWLMRGMHASPLVVSLVSAATTLPMLLLSIPAGALADVLDRRRLMLAVQAVMLALTLGLAAVTGARVVTPAVLLAAMFGLGVCAALTNPAWQTAMTDLVPAGELPAASALNSVSLNVSRAVGPAVGGLILAAAGAGVGAGAGRSVGGDGFLGPAAIFAARGLGVVGLLVALVSWRYRRPDGHVDAGARWHGAMVAGVRQMRRSPVVVAVLVRTASFVLPASSAWGLMPVIAKDHLGLGASGYGLLMSCLGGGAVGAMLVLPRARRGLTPNRLIVVGTTLYAAACLGLGLSPALGGGRASAAAGLASMVIAGAGWVTMVVVLNVAAQLSTPAFARGRAIAAYFTVFFGSMAVGSVLWGAVAERVGIGAALRLAACGGAAGLLTMVRWPLRPGAGEANEPTPATE